MAASANSISICHWNACGLSDYSKQVELGLFLSKHNVDICLLNETLLSKTKKLKIPDYHQYINYMGRGTAVLVKKQGLKHHEIQVKGLEMIETSAVQIKVAQQKIAIVASYFSPNPKKKG